MNRIIWIDSLKGLGAFIVYFCHFNGLFQLIELPKWGSILTNGQFAVGLFLILSGFSISLSMERQNTPNKIRITILKRYFRFAIPIGFIETMIYIIFISGGFYNQEVAEITHSSFASRDFIDISFFSYLKSLLWSPLSFKILLRPLWMMKYIFLGSLLIILLSMGTHSLTTAKKIIVVFLAMIVSLYISILFICFIGNAIMDYLQKKLYVIL